MRRSYSLIEILIVVVIIGIIASIAVPAYYGIGRRNNIARAKADIRAVQVALESYYLHNNSVYPLTLGALESAVPNVIKTVPGDVFSPQAAYGYSRAPDSGPKYYAVYSVGPQGTGSVTVNGAGELAESSGDSCIYVSNIQEDRKP